MAKDPAVLFYTSDFLTGTILMTNEQKGKYITLLCLQHQKGGLTKQDMLNICGTYDKDVFDKFNEIDGLFYNLRMKNEQKKRSEYSKSRSENRLKGIENQKNKIKKRGKSSYDNHMENENINNNIDNRKLELYNSLKPFVKTYGKEMIRDFYDYWTEPNKSNTKFRMELQSTWDVKRRLETWHKNKSKFDFKEKPIINTSNWGMGQ